MYKFLRHIMFCFLLCSSLLSSAQTIIIGTGTTSNSGTTYPAPYGNWYWGARHQFIIKASEINALGVSGLRAISSLAFSVKTRSGTALSGYSIKIKNTTAASFSSTGFAFETGLTTVYSSTSFKDTIGWNTHVFQTPFIWDGISNLLIDICFNNTSSSSNSQCYYSTTSFNSVIDRYADNVTNNCTQSALYASTKRPNMRLNFISPPTPIASFNILNNITDTLIINRAYTFQNTSQFVSKSYWRILGLNNSLCNNTGCFKDTLNTNHIETFSQVGNYKITLVVKGYVGYDSITRNIYVDSSFQKPKANFYLSSYSIATPSVLLCYDSSLFGVTNWQWSISPLCNSCATNPYVYPNNFIPNATTNNPYMYVSDPGIFDVCLKVWNDKGFDSICKKNVLNISQGYFMCNGADSFSNLSSGFIYDNAGPDENYQVGLTGQCIAGFVINPATCADTITLVFDRFKLRTTDTLQIRDGGTSTSPIIKKLTGGNLSSANKILKASSGKMYLRMTTGSGSFTSGDTGFIAHWSIIPSSKIRTSTTSFCENESLVLPVNKKAGKTYQWKFNESILSAFTDTFCIAKNAGTYKVIITSGSCKDSSLTTLTKNIITTTHFDMNDSLQCVNKNAFIFKDNSSISKGSYTRAWSFGDNTFSTDSFIVKKYTVPGVYFVSLSTITNNGCKDTVSHKIYVPDAPVSIITLASTNNLCSYDSALMQSSLLHANNYKWYIDNTLLLNDTQSFLWTKKVGNYSLKVTNSYGCDSMSETVHVLFKAEIPKPIITRNGNVLHSSSTTNNQWYFNNNLLVGATQPNFGTFSKGSYTVMVKEDGCESISDPFIFNNTGINELNEQNNFLHIYPNPASSELNITSTEPFTWLVLDITSRVILKSNNASAAHQIDINSLSNGVYFLKVIYDQNIVVTRFEKL